MLVAGIAASAAGALLVDHQFDQRDQRDFDREALDARAAIERRGFRYTEALYGIRGLVTLTGPLDRAEFNRYISTVGTAQRLPGARVFSYVSVVRHADLARFEESMRARIPGFSVHPRGTRDHHYVVTHVEPLKGNESAIGLDLGFEPSRVAAIESARDTADPTTTGPVELVQGGRGFILFLALYDRESVPITAPARRRSNFALVNAVFLMEEMMAGMLGPQPKIDIEIYDVGHIVADREERPSPERLLFDSNDERVALGDAKLPERSRVLDLHMLDRRWRIYATPAPGTDSIASAVAAAGVGVAGALLAALVAALIFTLGRSQRLAVGIAEQMTASLRQRESELEDANASLQRANGELEQLADRLRRADRERNAFLGTISHELRTPLQAITGFTEVLERRVENLSAHERRDFLERISRNAVSLRSLIEELLDFSRIQRDSFHVEPESLPLGGLTRDVTNQLAPLLADHHVDLDLVDDPRVVADRNAATRALANLLTNAAKYAPDGTRIAISVHRDGDTGFVRIADEGPGIAEQERDRIFEPFFRGTVPKRVPGTGVGLSVTKALVELMGGSVALERTGDSGSCFRIDLPLQQTRSPEIVTPDRRAPDDGPTPAFRGPRTT